MLDSIHQFITTSVSDYGYVAIFVLMLLESACIPIPSEVTMLFGGALTVTAFAGAGNELNLLLVTVAGVAGNLIGSWLAYSVGAAGGRPMIDRFGRYLLVRPHEVDKAHTWFERRGHITVFTARLLPVIRTFISLPAGVARMPFARFTLYTLLGVIPWTFGLAWLGARLGSRWDTVTAWFQPISWLIVAAIVVGVAVYVARRWRQVRAEYAALDAERAAAGTVASESASGSHRGPAS